MGRPKKPIYGVGINDAPYNTQPVVNGKKIWCKYAGTWKDMIERCYSTKFQEKYPSYKGVEVCEEWKSFMNFKAWMEKQPHTGRQLDKDILGDGKLYSPNTCRFITQQTNSILSKTKKTGTLPLGVFQEKSGRFKACCKIKGVSTHLGCTSDKMSAHRLWQKAKAHAIKVQADSGEECAEIVAALHTRVNTLLSDLANNAETRQL